MLAWLNPSSALLREHVRFAQAPEVAAEHLRAGLAARPNRHALKLGGRVSVDLVEISCLTVGVLFDSHPSPFRRGHLVVFRGAFVNEGAGAALVGGYFRGGWARASKAVTLIASFGLLSAAAIRAMAGGSGPSVAELGLFGLGLCAWDWWEPRELRMAASTLRAAIHEALSVRENGPPEIERYGRHEPGR